MRAMDFCASLVNPFRIGSGAVNALDSDNELYPDNELDPDESEELSGCSGGGGGGGDGGLFIDAPTTILSDKMIERIYRSFEHFIKKIYSSEWHHYTMSFKKD
jgi:hypothetical protein